MPWRPALIPVLRPRPRLASAAVASPTCASHWQSRLLGWPADRRLLRDNAAAPNQADHDTRPDNEGQHESVHGVPRRCPAADRGLGVGKIQKVENDELRDESVFRRHQHRGPCHRGRNHTKGISSVTLSSAISGIFQAPVDRAEKRDDLEDDRGQPKNRRQSGGESPTTAPYPIWIGSIMDRS